ncbi:MAG: mobile mystery protein B [Treponema sp.]|nr:mobile mystery protein B [Treponema sp.]
MNADIFAADDNATPLSPDEKEGLKQKWVTLRSELNELETRNILDAQRWLMQSSPKDILNDSFLRKLHKKMFGQVWTWAGEYRTTERNIGVSPFQIPMNVMNLFEDVKFWIENKTYSEKEIAVRLHHRLVQIHPFPNGNGRVSRIMADLCMRQMNKATLNWGSYDLSEINAIREKYIHALRKADAGDYSDLLAFVDEE